MLPGGGAWSLPAVEIDGAGGIIFGGGAYGPEVTVESDGGAEVATRLSPGGDLAPSVGAALVAFKQISGTALARPEGDDIAVNGNSTDGVIGGRAGLGHELGCFGLGEGAGGREGEEIGGRNARCAGDNRVAVHGYRLADIIVEAGTRGDKEIGELPGAGLEAIDIYGALRKVDDLGARCSDDKGVALKADRFSEHGHAHLVACAVGWEQGGGLRP